MSNNCFVYSIACCPTISIVLGSDVKNIQVEYEGLYSYNGTINGRDYWVKFEGGSAIWYIPDFKDWAIGEEMDLGSKTCSAQTSSDLESTCPKNAKNDWNYLDDDKWMSTNDVQLNCIGNHTKL